jgi:pimeloyl-ACP methyl ester carboxylesterase
VGDNPLAAGARRRRETFPSREAALANFSSKPPLAGVDPGALLGYLDGGFELVPSDQGGDGTAVRLRCRRDDEAAVFDQGFFHTAYPHLSEVACPVTLCCGEDEDLFSPAVMAEDARQLRHGRVEVLPGVGHFGPLEQPAAVAASITAALLGATSTGGDTPRS